MVQNEKINYIILANYANSQQQFPEPDSHSPVLSLLKIPIDSQKHIQEIQLRNNDKRFNICSP
jgi:hypothetical protein